MLAVILVIVVGTFDWSVDQQTTCSPVLLVRLGNNRRGPPTLFLVAIFGGQCKIILPPLSVVTKICQP
jgi:hypothetical protein